MQSSDNVLDLEKNDSETRTLPPPESHPSWSEERLPPAISEITQARSEVDVGDLPSATGKTFHFVDPSSNSHRLRIPAPRRLTSTGASLPTPAVASGISTTTPGEPSCEGRDNQETTVRETEVEERADEYPHEEAPEEEQSIGENDDTAVGRERQRKLRSSRLGHLRFHDRLAATGIRHLYARGGSGQRRVSYNIALSTLQRMVIHEQQRKLVFLVKGIVRRQEVSDATLTSAHKLLAQYTTAIRDYDFMTEKLSRATESDERDPFMITTEDALSLYLMRDALLVPEGQPVHAHDRARYTKRMNILPGASRTLHNSNARLAGLWERIWMGACGGLALIGPMLLMVLHKGEVTSLSTASVATMLFALGLAILGKDLKGQEVLASVAAYAAVLVVFVGASS